MRKTWIILQLGWAYLVKWYCWLRLKFSSGKHARARMMYRAKCLIVPGYKKRSDAAWNRFKDEIRNTDRGRAAFRAACLEVLEEDPNDW